ncbi:hypothetical protein [Frankia sp. CiP3]|uniref:hypothetical protein n=1 Tax=Frankia sp. CiP3 TaxID=2880971 RepID=UPI001EF52E81|nr:hypothetical protein [Frankia sp. CiP3]
MSSTDEQESSTIMAVFAGFTILVQLVKSIVTRSRHANRFGRTDWRIPVLCLVDAGTADSALKVLAGRFVESGKRRVPHTYVDVTQVSGLQPLLHQLHEKLAVGRFSRDPLRFRCFTLVDWLTAQNLSNVPVAKRQRELARRLRREFGLRGGQGEGGLDHGFTGWLGLLLSLFVRALPVVALRLLVSGRLPGAGHEFRWFRRQQYLASGPASTFLAVAERLTIGPRADEEPEAIDRLLTDAFLEDLRVQYRRRPWRLRPWRRTAYPVILLDAVAPDNAGYALIRAVTAVRGDGWTDPLLIVTRGVDVPLNGTPLAEAVTDGRVVPLMGLDAAYSTVHDRLPMAGKRGHPDTWLLPVAVSGINNLNIKDRLPVVIPARPPWLAQPWMPAVVVLLLISTFVIWIVGQIHPGCATLPLHRGDTLRVIYIDRQCIGYSGSDRQAFGPDERLTGVQKKIFAQNREAASAHQVKRNRPLVTLVYLAAFTRTDSRLGDEVFDAEREGLEGVAAAQYRAMHEADNNPASPYLRVIVGNVGDETRHADKLVPMLAQLVHDDPTVIATVAQLDSRTKTQYMLQSLDAVGLPTLTLTTSADGIAGASNLYLQLSPSNRDEVGMIHSYVSQVLHRDAIINFYTYGAKGRIGGDEDLYVNTLRNDLHAEFVDHYREKFWPSGTDVSDICSDKFDGIVFFGGRYTEFPAFVSRVYTDCGGRLPTLLADGSVSRYIANSEMRAVAPTTLPVAYISRGQLGFCEQLKNAHQPERINFLNDIRDALGFCDGSKPIQEWVSLGYDAARLLLRSVTDIASRRPAVGIDHSWDPAQINPKMVYSQIRQSVDLHQYEGVSGILAFDQNGIARTRHISIMCAADLKRVFQTNNDVPYEVYRSGLTYPDEPPLRPRPCSS